MSHGWSFERVRGQSTEDDVVCKAKLQDLKRLMRCEAVAYQYARFAVDYVFGPWIEDAGDPFQADRRGICVYGEVSSRIVSTRVFLSGLQC